MPSVEKLLADANRIADPEDRAKRIQTVVLPALQELWDQVHNDRALAILELNETGMGYRTIGRNLGMSMPRAQQIVAEGRRIREGESRWVPKADDESGNDS